MSAPIPGGVTPPETLTSGPAPAPARNSRSERRRLARIGIALVVAVLAYSFAHAVINSALIAAKIAILVPDDKVFWLSVSTAAAGLVSAIAAVIWGAISDRTRSRFGRRTPWILVGGIGAAVFPLLMGVVQTPMLLMLASVGYMIVVNAQTAALLAVFPDRIPVMRRGTYSALYGGGQVFGSVVGTIVASGFLTNPDPLFFLLPPFLAGGAILFVLIAPDKSSLEMPAVETGARAVLASFRFPRNAPDFYWAYGGRFLIMLGSSLITSFQLYVLTDYIMLGPDETAQTLATSGAVTLLSVLVGTAVGGPISDKLGRRKMPIFVASLLFVVAVIFPLVSPTALSMIIFGGITGLGLGAFLAADAALMTQVLPSEDDNAKDLGILSTATTIPVVLAPVVTGTVVTTLGYSWVFVTSIVILVVGAFSVFKIKSVR